MKYEVVIEHQEISLKGIVSFEAINRGWVIFVHGSGSSRNSPRNRWVASELNRAGYATFLFDLLTPDEDTNYENRFNISLLADRLLIATRWLTKSEFYHHEPLIYFGASTGAAAAILASGYIDNRWDFRGVISRGGRPDLAGKNNPQDVPFPVLLIVGEKDPQVIELNRSAQKELRECSLELIPGAGHLFEEEGTLAKVVESSIKWLEKILGPRAQPWRQDANSL